MQTTLSEKEECDVKIGNGRGSDNRKNKLFTYKDDDMLFVQHPTATGAYLVITFDRPLSEPWPEGAGATLAIWKAKEDPAG